MNNIGEGDNALLCMTDNPACCKPPNGPKTQGDFYYPNNNSAVGFSSMNSLYRNRGPQVVRLNRGSTAIPSGIYRCAIPDFDNITQNIHINITSGMETHYINCIQGIT